MIFVDNPISDVGEITCGPFTASVTWKIEDFFGFPKKGHRRLESRTFYFFDATWSLRAYPNGDNKNNEWISLYLVKKCSSSPKLQISFRFGILSQDGSIVRESRHEYMFETNEIGTGAPSFLKISDLKNKNEIMPDGVLTIVCTMSANMCEGVHAAVQTEIPVGTERLVQDFKKLLLNEEASDFTLSVKNQEYKVHRAILTARSTVFSAMLKNDMKEKSCSIVEISDCDPNAFQQFLTYLYTGNLENISVDTICALHSIAHKYDVEDLEESCVQFMMNNLYVEIFCDVLSVSLKYSESELLKKTVEFFAKNMKNILVTTKWLSFTKENPVESNELHIKAVEYYVKHGFNVFLDEQDEFSDEED